MESDCSISILLLKVRCDTIHLCRCTVFLKDVRSFVSGVSSYFVKYMGGPDYYGGKSIPVASICKCVDVLLVRIITQT